MDAEHSMQAEQQSGRAPAKMRPHGNSLPVPNQALGLQCLHEVEASLLLTLPLGHDTKPLCSLSPLGANTGADVQSIVVLSGSNLCDRPPGLCHKPYSMMIAFHCLHNAAATEGQGLRGARMCKMKGPL